MGGKIRAAALYPHTSDGRYFVVRGRLWRRSNPALSSAERERLVRQLMRARSGINLARRSGDLERLQMHRGQVHKAKVALGERGAVWWSDGQPDLNRVMARNSPYAEWFENLESS